MENLGQRRWLRRISWLLLAVLLLWAITWLAVPPLARYAIERYGSEALGRQVQVQKVVFRPWALQVDLEGLRIAGLEGQPAQLEIGRIHLDTAVQSLWKWAPVIDALEVDAPHVRLARTGPAQWDIDDILQRLAQAPKSESDKSQRFALYNVVVRTGAVDFDDRSLGARQEVRGLHLAVPFLSNLPADRQVTVTPRLALTLNGSEFDSAVQATPFAEQPQSQVRWKIDDLDLSPFAPYLPAVQPVRLQSGRLDADVRVDFALQDDHPVVQLAGSVVLKEVRTTDPQGARLLDVDRVHVVMQDVQPLQQRVDIASMDITGLRTGLRRDASGALVLPTTNQPTSPAAADAAAGKDEASPWRLRLGRLTLDQGAFDWEDASVQHAGAPAQWQLSQLRLQASDLTWPQSEAAQWKASAELQGAGVAAAQWALQGQGTLEQAQVALSVRDQSLGMAAPYLAQWLQTSVDGSLDADVGLALQGSQMALKVGRATLERVRVACPKGAGPCVSLGSEKVAQAAADTQLQWARLQWTDALILPQQQRAQLGQVVLTQPKAVVARDQSGHWMVDRWLRTAPVSEPAHKPESAAQPSPWSVALQSLQIEEGALVLRDAAAPIRPVVLGLSALQLRAAGVSWSQGRLAPLQVQLDTRIAAGRAEPGRFALQGRVAMDPRLQAKARIHARNVPLHVLDPYVAQQMNVSVVRADGGFSGDVEVEERPAGMAVGVLGDATLDDLRVRIAADGRDDQQLQATLARIGGQGEELLRWKSLGLKGVALQLAPGKPLALDVRETALSDFFARIIVQENGRLNLQELQRVPPGADGVAANASPPTAAAEAQALAPVIRFGPVALSHGEVDFTDHFIKPNYSANLTELVGNLSAFSSIPAGEGQPPEMAALQLRGKAQGTAALEVTGQINPLVQPLALDIRGQVHDLELPPLSPYSVKYAGHGIERGKLSMDVSYKIAPDGKLTASNKLVLNQLAFGDAVQDAPASLPVRLAVALLADRNGVIDLDLPISGSLNDPEFRLGPVIFKAIANLVMKAITAPFSLLANAFGGSDEQGEVPFAPGSAQLDPAARAQLDQVAKALADRPALKLTVTGWAQPEAELEAYRRQKLQDLLLSQKRRAAVRAGEDPTEIRSVSAEESPALLKEVYRRADNITKRRNLVGLPKDVPAQEMEQLLLQGIQVPEGAMSELALARGVAVRDYLASRQIPQDRLFVGASKLEPAKELTTAWKPKAQLSLSTR